jgi:hypothetical protein
MPKSKKPTPKPNLEELKAQMSRIRDQIYAIENEKNVKAARALVGKCYKFPNSYGGDSKPWTGYGIVLKEDTGGVVVRTFEVRRNKEISIQQSWVQADFVNRYTPITRAAFDRALAKTSRHISKLLEV